MMTRSSGGKLASYIVTDKDCERAELWQLRGFAGLELKDGFRVVEAMAAATHCERRFFIARCATPRAKS